MYLMGCQSPNVATTNDEDEPTWSFKNLQWQGVHDGKAYALHAKSLKHFETRVEGKNVTFSIQTKTEEVTGEAQSTQFIQAAQEVTFQGLTLETQQLGTFRSTEGSIDLTQSEAKLIELNGVLRNPILELRTPEAILRLNPDDTLSLETSTLNGRLPSTSGSP